jgi:methionyl-tRNA formyltransferase
VRVIFLGTPAFAVPALDALARAGHEIARVVAQPDRPAGRGQQVQEPPTKRWARERGIAVLQPEKVRDGRLAAELSPLSPDVLVVVAYGRILGTDLLRLAPEGAVNVHASLLPTYRGAAPIQWALAEGERETGVTVMQMDEGLDTGDVLLQRTLPIADDDTAASLAPRLAALGGEALVTALALAPAGRLVPVRQDPARATLAPVLEKDHGRLDFSLPAQRLASRARGFTPWPGAFTTLGGRLLKVHRARAVGADAVPRARPEGDAVPGQAYPTADGVVVACGEGALLLEEVQLEGRRRLAASEFVKGQAIAPGTVLGR